MSNEVQRTENSLPSIVRVWCRDHQKELLTTLLAIAAIGAVLLSIHALSYAGLSGLNSLNSSAAAAYIASLLIGLNAYCYYHFTLEEFERQSAAATTIQRAYRKYHKLKNEREKAATTIQKACRKHIVRLENILLQAAYLGNGPLLNALAERWPRVFKKNEQEIVAEFLLRGHKIFDEGKYINWNNLPSIQGMLHIMRGKSLFYEFLEKAELDPFHRMWLQVAKKLKPDDNFKKEFEFLSPAQKKTLYDAAFTYSNTFVYGIRSVGGLTEG